MFDPRNWLHSGSSVGAVEDAVQCLEPNPGVDDIDLALLEVESEIEKAKTDIGRAPERSHALDIAYERVCALSGALIVLRRLRPPESDPSSTTLFIDPDCLGLIHPTDIDLPKDGVLTATLGSSETEAVAALILLWHYRHSSVWAPFSLPMLAYLLRADPVARRWGRNPVWARFFLAGLGRMLDEGWVVGWVDSDPDSQGQVTQAFLNKLIDSRWDKAKSYPQAEVAHAG